MANCKFCGRDGYRWVKHKGKFRLVDEQGFRHLCPAAKSHFRQRFIEREEKQAEDGRWRLGMTGGYIQWDSLTPEQQEHARTVLGIPW